MSERLFTKEEVDEIVYKRVAAAIQRLKQKHGLQGANPDRRGDVKPMTFNEGKTNV